MAIDREKRLAQMKEWKKNNPEKDKEYSKRYRANNPEKRLAQKKRWREENRDKIAARKRERKIKDPSYKFIVDLRNRQCKVLKGTASTTAGLGCTRQELLDHLSRQFQPEMTLENHGRGGWTIDHIIPLSSYQKDSNGNWDPDSEYNKKLVHYTNLQPLWEKDNLEKSNKIISYEHETQK